ncbi:hypothetical protein [Pseudomonas sp. FEN]|nr:hypothetical protein [Pseudomonas sp. FEN]
MAFRSELLGLLHQRGEALAGRVVASGAVVPRRSPISCCCNWSTAPNH